MSTILKFDFRKRKQLRFSEVNYLTYTKKDQDPILHVATTFSLKQGETRISHGLISHPLNARVEKTIVGYHGTPLLQLSVNTPTLIYKDPS